MESTFSKTIKLVKIMEVSGKVKVVSPVIQVSDSFRKRELVVTTDEQYPQNILIEFVQDKSDLLNNVAVGEAVKVSINLSGREWVSPQGETKYFNSIKGWRVEKMQAETPVAPVTPTVPVAEAFPPATNFNEAEHDDLPF
jgi:hypothetical protein